MTSLSYDYITEYMKKWKLSLAWYDVAINSTMHTCILLEMYSTGDVLNYRLYIRLGSLMDKALDLRIRGREFEFRYVQEFFIL